MNTLIRGFWWRVPLPEGNKSSSPTYRAKLILVISGSFGTRKISIVDSDGQLHQDIVKCGKSETVYSTEIAIRPQSHYLLVCCDKDKLLLPQSANAHDALVAVKSGIGKLQGGVDVYMAVIKKTIEEIDVIIGSL